MATTDVLCQLAIIVKAPQGYDKQGEIHRRLSQDFSPIDGEIRVAHNSGDVLIFTPSAAVHAGEVPDLAGYMNKLTTLFSTENQSVEFQLAYLTETRVVLVSNKETFDRDIYIGGGKYACAVGVCRPHGAEYTLEDFAPQYFAEAADFLREARQKFIQKRITQKHTTSLNY